MHASQPPTAATPTVSEGARRGAYLAALEKKILWLSTWTIHHANHLREKSDGLKVGGHQASSASSVALLTALYFDVLQPQDRVAVKPHASPVFHAIQYLFGRQSRQVLERFRAFGGAQAYPSRTKDVDDVDFSTGSVGLGVATTGFAALVQEYVRLKGLTPRDVPPGRLIALAGDAELDEGNVFEALLDCWKHRVANLWWIIDYNRQSLDAVFEERLSGRLDRLFKDMGWNVKLLKYGKRLEAAFKRRGGEALRHWIDECPNPLYSALVYKGGASWRERLRADLGDTAGIREILDDHDDVELARLMTNLGGHDLDVVLEAFRSADGDDPVCFIAYTIKGFGLPLAGHKDNHSGIMNPAQMETFKSSLGIKDGEEWNIASGSNFSEEELRAFIDSVPFAAGGTRRHRTTRISVPRTFDVRHPSVTSTQRGFGLLLNEIAREGGELADRIVTTSPDVAVSTDLGSWVNRRGIFHVTSRQDTFKEQSVAAVQNWVMSPQGQHIELGIAENNFFLLLGMLGLADTLFGVRLLPIGTLYDPFIERGLDALNYACYQGSRFLLVGTPSGVTLAPEGGAHQSIVTPLIGMGQPGLTMFEPSYVDELVEIAAWSFEHLQDKSGGGSVYLRLSTKPVPQPDRKMTPDLRDDIVVGAYWYVQPPDEGSEMAIVCCGSVTSEALAAYEAIVEDLPDLGVLVVTSVDRLYSEWCLSRQPNGGNGTLRPSHIERLLSQLSPDAGLVTIVDGHPAALSWLGAVRGHRVIPLGVQDFGQSGTIPELYHAYRLDADAVIAAAARLCVDRDIGRKTSG